MEEELRFCLIVSQYFHSRHLFIVNIDENFLENARLFATELIAYKRSDERENRGLYLGDLSPEYCGVNLRPRYNINDAGDIYFINYVLATRCMNEAFDYRESSRRQASGFQKKSISESIAAHHKYGVVEKIVKKYFKVA